MTERFKSNYNEIKAGSEEGSSMAYGITRWGALGTIVGEAVLLSFPIAFLIGGAQWGLYSEGIGADIFEGLEVLFWSMICLYATMQNKTFLTGNYLSRVAIDTVPKISELRSMRTLHRTRTIVLLLSTIVISVVVNNVVSWGWMDRNSQFIPNKPSDNVLNAPLPGAYVADTRHPGNVEFVRFDFNQVIPIFTRIAVIIVSWYLYYRMSDDNDAATGEGTYVNGGHLAKWSVFSVTGFLTIGLTISISLVFIIASFGTTSNIYITALGWVFLAAFVIFIVFLSSYYFEHKSRDFPDELHYRFVLCFIFYVFWFAVGSIYFLYVATTVPHHGPEWNNGKYPKFDATAPPSGQSNYYYITQDIAMAFGGSVNWIFGFLAIMIFESAGDGLLSQLSRITPAHRHPVATVTKWLYFIGTALIVGFLLQELCGEHYLNTRFTAWTISILVIYGAISHFHAFNAYSLVVHEKTKLQKSALYSTVESIATTVSTYYLMFWITIYMQTHFGSLNHVASTANIVDETNPLSVFWWIALTTQILLLILPLIRNMEYLWDRIVPLGNPLNKVSAQQV